QILFREVHTELHSTISGKEENLAGSSLSKCLYIATGKL
ncbi:hypothetical protein NPIL_199841, partial [Nephila pilipes]